MPARTYIPPRDLDRANSMRAARTPWTHIASTLGVGVKALRSQLDPEFLERYRSSRSERTGRFIGSFNYFHAEYDRDVDPRMVEARRAAIPKDTRSLTGQLLGDPLPGRSALHKGELYKMVMSAVGYFEPDS